MKKQSRLQLISEIILLAYMVMMLVVFLLMDNVPNLLAYAMYAGFGGALCVVIVSFISKRRVKKMTYLENRLGLWNSISYRVKGAGETAFNKMPVGILVYNNSLEIEWANAYAKEAFRSQLVERNIHNVDPKLAGFLQSNTINFNINLYGKTYECSVIKENNILYLRDVTERIEYLAKYRNRTLAIGILHLDNLNNALGALDAKERSSHITSLIGIITEWCEKYNICTLSYSDERYLLVFDYVILQEVIKENFDILDKIREYCSEQFIRITASIGIACSDVDADKLFEQASGQLRLALDRGGDQTAVSIDGETSYYGAKSIVLEGRTSIQIRVKAQELGDLIKRSEKVFIMGHTSMDADAFGGALALYKMVKAYKKEVYIAIDEKKIDKTVETIYSSIKNEHTNALGYFMSIKDATKALTQNSLLIIVDCQFQNILIDDKIYKKAKHIAVIDHHRSNANTIHNYDYLYIQSSASSSVELVVEMYDYLEEKEAEELDVSDIEATWMLIGIAVDTNNFAYRTSNRTFNVLAKLQTYGASTAAANRYLRDEYKEFVKRNLFLSNIDLINEHYAIVTCDDDIYTRAFIAKIADDLILVEGVKLAFCIGKIADDLIAISARSLDESNAQVAMERLGGGGHFNNAATQIQGVTIEEAKSRLIQVIDNLYQGDNGTMKVILIKDVKGKGKVHDVIDVTTGYGNYLLRNAQAIEATPDNLKKLEQDLAAERIANDKKIDEARELKEKINSITVSIKVKVGTQGKLYGSVTSKQICEELKAQYNIELGKHQVMLNKSDMINALGTYNIPIYLHKEVIASLTVYVVEKE